MPVACLIDGASFDGGLARSRASRDGDMRAFATSSLLAGMIAARLANSLNVVFLSAIAYKP